MRQSNASIRRALRFVLIDPEPDSFTYVIANEPELARWVATVSGCDLQAAATYVAEPALGRCILMR